MRRGLSPGETLALDDRTLYSARLGLAGRPDRILCEAGTRIPEEWKTSKCINRGHELQLGTYFLLMEEEFGERPPHGYIVLGDGSRARVENTDSLRSEVLRIAAEIRARRAIIEEAIPVRQPFGKCRACGQGANCARATRG